MDARDEAEAALAARRELGPEMEPAVVDAFVERVERAIEARVDERLAERGGVARRRDSRPAGAPWSNVWLGLGSMGIGIGATGAATGMGDAGILVAIVAWIAIGAVNVVNALGR